MKDGFIKVAAATPSIKVADTEYNADVIIDLIKKAAKKGVKIICFPELCITGSTCGDLFKQKTLTDAAEEALQKIVKKTEKLDIVSIVGLPRRFNTVLKNCAAVISHGQLFTEEQTNISPDKARYFHAGDAGNSAGFFLVDSYENMDDMMWKTKFSFAVTIGDDTANENIGASMIFNLSSDFETVSAETARKIKISAKSSALKCAYIQAGAGEGESSTDFVFAGQRIIAENGKLISVSEPFEPGLTITDIDVDAIAYSRMSKNFGVIDNTFLPLETKFSETKLERPFRKLPFVPDDKDELSSRLKKVIRMQCEGLKKRMLHANAQKIVIGISGGLDSTLAVIVASETMKLLSKPASDIVTVTMPCFGTTSRTKSNAQKICEEIGTTFREVSIANSVSLHFEDIGHDKNVTNAAFENAQARERTQVLMDIANDINGLVVGTGDLSELALGWATYNGDHMSMYGVNGSVTKTLIRYIVRYYAENCGNKKLKTALIDVIDTPVSPELLPAKDGQIAQKTEDLVGPYELHDFFLYHFIHDGYGPEKLYRTACYTFAGEYDAETILKWLKNFTRRFFSQQFKRSCVPDGIKVGSVSLSPRGDYVMPSDAMSTVWLSKLDKIKPE